jgi:pimeloyl-ACP methyl ester carboxylesterase
MEIEPTKIHFISGGSKLTGWVFRCNTQSSNPLAVLLHGYPGSERDPLGLGSMLKDGCINVITFNYRGTWESEGINSYENSIDDILSVSSFVHSNKLSQDLELQPSSISFIGYSYGGGVVLIASTIDTRIRRIALLAPLNLGEFGRQLLENEELRTNHEAFLDETMGENGLIRGPGGKMMHQQFIDSIQKNDLFGIIDKLVDKDILILGGENDEDLPYDRHVLPLYTKLKVRNSSVYLEVYDTYHVFTGFVEQVADRLIMWVNST